MNTKFTVILSIFVADLRQMPSVVSSLKISIFKCDLWNNFECKINYLSVFSDCNGQWTPLNNERHLMPTSNVSPQTQNTNPSSKHINNNNNDSSSHGSGVPTEPRRRKTSNSSNTQLSPHSRLKHSLGRDNSFGNKSLCSNSASFRMRRNNNGNDRHLSAYSSHSGQSGQFSGNSGQISVPGSGRYMLGNRTAYQPVPPAAYKLNNLQDENLNDTTTCKPHLPRHSNDDEETYSDDDIVSSQSEAMNKIQWFLDVLESIFCGFLSAMCLFLVS